MTKTEAREGYLQRGSEELGEILAAEDLGANILQIPKNIARACEEVEPGCRVRGGRIVPFGTYYYWGEWQQKGKSREVYGWTNRHIYQDGGFVVEKTYCSDVRDYERKIRVCSSKTGRIARKILSLNPRKQQPWGSWHTVVQRKTCGCGICYYPDGKSTEQLIRRQGHWEPDQDHRVNHDPSISFPSR